MGIQPSKTELYLPSQTLRECHPDRCWCDRPYHRSSRYVYVERGDDGRERYQDPVDMFSSFLMGAGPAPQMPWKDPRSWTVRDYEKLGEVMEEWASREYRKNYGSNSRGGGGGGGGSGYPPWPGMGGGGGGYWDGDYGSGGGRHHGGRRSRRYVPWDQFEDLKSNFHQMAEQYQRHMSEQDAFLFGSDTDRRKEQYRQNMLNQLKEMMPQLAQMMYSGGGMAQQQQQQQQHFFPRQQMPGMMPNPMMPCNATGGTMPGMGMAGVAPTVGCGMPATPMPDPMQAAAAMNGMMNNPMAAAAVQQQSMTPAAAMQMGMNPGMMNGGVGVMPPMMNNGMMMNGMMDQQQPPLPPANMSRRARRRNFTAYDDGFDDDYDDFRPRRAGFRRRRDWRDDGDMLGGYTGDMRGPRGPMPGGSGPHRPVGGLVFDDDVESVHASMGAGHGNGPPRAQPTYPHDASPTYGNRAAAAAASNFSPPLRRPDYNAADVAASADAQQNRSAMHGADTIYAQPMEAAEGMYTRMAFQARAGATDSAPDMDYGGLYPASYGMGGGHSGMAAAAPYASASTGPEIPTAAAGPSMMRSAMKRTVSFDPGVATETPHLTRPRQEEGARGEANAGAAPDPRDGLGKSKGI